MRPMRSESTASDYSDTHSTNHKTHQPTLEGPADVRRDLIHPQLNGAVTLSL